MWWIVTVSNAYQFRYYAIFAINADRAKAKASRKWWQVNCRAFGKEEDYCAKPSTRQEAQDFCNREANTMDGGLF